LRSQPADGFAIVANGLLSDGPAQALRDYLVAHDARVVTIFHPLTAHEGNRHVISAYEHGIRIDERTVRLPLRAPLSYALDPFVPLVPPRVVAWFGFNPLACARGLVARKLGRARRVVMWSVDFTPGRFGSDGLLTRLYDRLDRACCVRADARVELSEAARDARNLRHGLGGDAAAAHVVPMGSWLDRVPTTATDRVARRRVVFLGHLVPGKGVERLLETLALLSARGEDVTADIVGTGPLEPLVHERARELGRERVRVRGFVADHRDVERILAEASLALAPYSADEASFTRYADPGKLKAYLAAGLPIVLTDVPPNARELEREAGAEIVDDDATAIADAVVRGLASAERWRERRDAALAYARRFDWNVLLADALRRLELEPGAP
jgi:glycosyltransferase involved in cell wall biosynthesis